jgi:hypothetical protein
VPSHQSHGREVLHSVPNTVYGPNYPELFRRAGDLVDKILRGTKPGDIPVEQPTNSIWSST